LAKQQSTDLQMPASHPFNSLALLRLAVATSDNGQPNRYVVESIFKHVWCILLKACAKVVLEAWTRLVRGDKCKVRSNVKFGKTSNCVAQRSF